MDPWPKRTRTSGQTADEASRGRSRRRPRAVRSTSRRSRQRTAATFRRDEFVPIACTIVTGAVALPSRAPGQPPRTALRRPTVRLRETRTPRSSRRPIVVRLGEVEHGVSARKPATSSRRRCRPASLRAGGQAMRPDREMAASGVAAVNDPVSICPGTGPRHNRARSTARTTSVSVDGSRHRPGYSAFAATYRIGPGRRRGN